MTTTDDIDARLERLAASTADIRPSPGFSQRVLLAVRADAAAGFWSNVRRGARRALPAAVLLAVLSLSWAVHRDRSARAQVASTYAALEVDW